MTIYYYERERFHGQGEFSSDQEAIEYYTNKYSDLLIIYKESDTDDGTPFINVWESK